MRIFLRDDVLLLCVKERFEFWEKAAFFAPRPKFRRKTFVKNLFSIVVFSTFRPFLLSTLATK